MNKDNLGKRTLNSFVIVIAISAVCFFFVDKPLTLFLQAHTNSIVSTVGEAVSALASGAFWKVCLAIFPLVIFYHDYRYGANQWSKNLFAILLSVMVATFIGEGLKFLLGRYRPVMLLSHDQYGFSLLADNWQQNSIPSGHTFRAFSLLVALALVWPRCRWLFIGVAVAIAGSRIVVLDHYLSDVILGAYLGVMSAVWSRWFIFYNKG